MKPNASEKFVNDATRSKVSLEMQTKSRICIVSEELGGFAGSGGIGAAMEELAACLASNSYQVDFMYVPVKPISDENKAEIRRKLLQLNVKAIFPDMEKYVWGGITVEKRSYSVYMHLKEATVDYDVIHFHEYKGLGYFSICAKNQGLDFDGTKIVVQIHGPTRWTIDANNSLFTHPDQLRIDFMEKKCIEKSDFAICPSNYILSWLNSNHFKLPTASNVRVIKNICSLATTDLANGESNDERIAIKEIILFARHEERKGFLQFCGALDRLSNFLASENIKVTFVGKLGVIRGKSSGAVITSKAANWPFPIDIKCGLDRYEALAFLKSKSNAVIVIPSPVENLPYTVFEAISLNKPVLTSAHGGAKELMCPTCHEDLLVEIDSGSIAKKILQAVRSGLPAARPAESARDIQAQWVAFHRELATLKMVQQKKPDSSSLPMVTLGITHYERPHKLVDAIVSAIKQTYGNLEIIVVDDGSCSPEAVAALDRIETLLNRCGGRLIRRENGYLGAARNSAIANARGEYIIFLDDDDLAFPDMVSNLVQSALSTNADITGCFNLFLEEVSREGATSNPEKFPQKLSYAPIGGPLSISSFENWIGASTSLIKLASVRKVGGYTELRNVGFEDYEFYVRALQAGLKLEILPRPLYLYEVGRPSMLSNTPTLGNYRRVIDAIEVDKDQAEWRDLINLNTGRKAAEEQENKIEWEFKVLFGNSSSTSLNASWWRMDGTPDEHVERLALYADSIGLASLSKAWRASLKQDFDVKSTYEQSLHLHSIREISEHAPFKSRRSAAELLKKFESSEIILDIHLGRFQQAMSGIMKSLNDNCVADNNVANAVRALSLSSGIEEFGIDVRNLVEKITTTRAAHHVRDSLMVSIAALLLKTKHKDLFDKAVMEIFVLDEREYVIKYAEVEDAILRRKILVSGLQHFKRHGLEEGRDGFRRMLDLADVLADISGRPIKPWTVGYIYEIEELCRASQD